MAVVGWLRDRWHRDWWPRGLLRLRMAVRRKSHHADTGRNDD
ncbi:hypothetical protein [Mycobacterium kiyosense]|nr:hypothetical protein [Mycobacterium kiyosense]